MAEIVWLSTALVLVISAVVILIGAYRRKNSLGLLVALLLLMSAGFPAAVYGAMSS